MKYKDGNFVQINRKIFKSSLSWQAKWLYTVLSELEHRFTDGYGRVNHFYRPTSLLCQDTGLTDKTLKKYRMELESAGLIQTWIQKVSTEGKYKNVLFFKILK